MLGFVIWRDGVGVVGEREREAMVVGRRLLSSSVLPVADTCTGMAKACDWLCDLCIGWASVTLTD